MPTTVIAWRPVPDAIGDDFTRFDGQCSRVVVFPSATLSALAGIWVRVRMRLDRLGDRRTIVEAYLAFAFVVESDGALAASVYTGGDQWDSVATATGVVPLGQWVDAGFVWDGRDTVSLKLGGQVVAARYLPHAAVPAVAWPYGLNVGAWPDRDLRVFDGAIAEVQLSRMARAAPGNWT